MEIPFCCNSVPGHQIVKKIFALATAAMLSCHVQKFLAIALLEFDKLKILSYLNCDGKLSVKWLPGPIC